MQDINTHIEKIRDIIKSKQGKENIDISGVTLFLQNNSFMRFLHNNYPSVYDFVSKCCYGSQKDCENYQVDTAAVTTHYPSGKIVLLVNYYFAQYFLDKTNFNNNETVGYDFLAKTLLHEMLHVILNHLGRNLTEEEKKFHNVATDMIIDNLISHFFRSTETQWRDWEEVAQIIKTLTGKPMSVSPQSKSYVLNYSDLYITRRILELPPELRQKLLSEYQRSCSSQHQWDRKYTGSLHSPLIKDTARQEESADKKEESKTKTQLPSADETNVTEADVTSEDFSLEDETKEYNERKNNHIDRITKEILSDVYHRRYISNIPQDQLILGISRAKYYDWKNKLRRYIPLVSSQVVTYTWKRPNRRLPDLVPGVRRKLKPGSVLLVFDVSGSMLDYYERDSVKSIIYTIYLTFMEVAKVNYLSRSEQTKIFTAQVDDKMLGEFEQVTSTDELINKEWNFYRGGGTAYQDVFDRILNEWRTIEENKVIPDLTIFVTDFGVDLSFLKQHKYRIFDGHLVWLYLTGSSYTIKFLSKQVPVGEIIPVYSNGG